VPSPVAPAHHQAPSSSRNCSPSGRCRIAVPFCSFSQAKQVVLRLLFLLVSRICGQPFFRSLSCSFVPPALPTPPMFPPVPATLRRMFTRSFSRTMCLLLTMIYLTALVVASPLPQAGPSLSRAVSHRKPPVHRKGVMKVGDYTWYMGWSFWGTKKFVPPKMAKVFCLFEFCYGFNAMTETVEMFILNSNHKTMAASGTFRPMKAVINVSRLDEEVKTGRLKQHFLKRDVSIVHNDEDWHHLFSGDLKKMGIIVEGYDENRDIQGNMKNGRNLGPPWSLVVFGYGDFDSDNKVSWTKVNQYYAGRTIRPGVIPRFLCPALFNKCFGFNLESNTIREISSIILKQPWTCPLFV
ncbi:hypothetical protein FB446DRAFT_310683, partial [Lentinula raphanica]